jgi:hypothetical protein
LDARQFADRKPNTFRNWLKSCPLTDGRIAASVGVALGEATLKAHATVSFAKDASIEEKVEFLLRQARVHDSAIARVDDRVDELRSSLKTSEKSLEMAVEQLSSSLRTIIAGHVVGAYDINLCGITMTICGTVIQFFLA